MVLHLDKMQLKCDSPVFEEFMLSDTVLQSISNDWSSLTYKLKKGNLIIYTFIGTHKVSKISP